MAAVVPVLDEEASVASVVAALTANGVARVVVVDNGSSDASATEALRAGAEVVSEPLRGYGRACLAGIRRLAEDPPAIVVFADGDGADVLEDLPSLIGPIKARRLDLVVGSRLAGRSWRAVPWHARVGNRLVTALMRLLFGAHYTDLGPLRAIRYSVLAGLGMSEPRFGWTAEMQARAALGGLRSGEVPVGYRRRVGRSKISGTFGGSLAAGTGMISTLLKLALFRPRCGE